MAILVRAAHDADVAPLSTLDGGATTDPVRTGKMASWVSAGHCVAAEVGGRLAGYAVTTDNFFGSDFVEVLIVASDQRRRGIGTAIMQYIADHGTSSKLWTSTNLSNLPMQRLLAKEGFILSGVVDNIDPGDPELFYLKRRDRQAPGA